MDVVSMRERAERLLAMIAALEQESDALFTADGTITLQEWDSYLAALLKAAGELRIARLALLVASDRIEGRTDSEGR
jgi:hypothetical protein